jgi:hypothetical protein
MRKIIASAIAFAVLGLSAPLLVATSANARDDVVIVKKDRGHHYGWYKHRYNRDYAWAGRRHYYHHRGAAVIVR